MHSLFGTIPGCPASDSRCEALAMRVLKTEAVCELLKIAPPVEIPTDPNPRSEELIIWYPGWTLAEMAANPVIAASGLLRVEADVHDDVPAGYYALRLPMKDSKRKGVEQQKALLRADEGVIPLRLTVFTLVLWKIAGEPDLLPTGHAVRCKEEGIGTNYIVRMTEAGPLQLGTLLRGPGRTQMAAYRPIEKET
jgi:hypothetical protein